MIAALSRARSLLASFWQALAQLEADSTGAPRLASPDLDEAELADPDRIAEREAAFLAILHGPVRF